MIGEKMIYIPKTSPKVYVSSILALNILSPDGTGDWHSSMYWGHPERNNKIDLWIFGEGQKFNTNYLIGDLGIIDGTSRLNEMGYFPENTPVWIAEHPRAMVDIMFSTVLQTGPIDTIILDDWFPSLEDKEKVYRILNVMENKLNSTQRERLEQWKLRNPLME